jgi:hypothetical protein
MIISNNSPSVKEKSIHLDAKSHKIAFMHAFAASPLFTNREKTAILHLLQR